MTRILSIGLLACALALGGCIRSRSSGSVHGRVLSNGAPVAGVRVTLDDLNHELVITNIRGEFHIGGASSGTHAVLAYEPMSQQAASVQVEIGGGETAEAGDLALAACAEILADAGGSPQAIPCNAPAPPPPPVTAVHYDSLTADIIAGNLDPSGIYVSGQDTPHDVFFDFYMAGDFTGGGSATLHVDNSGGPQTLSGQFGLSIELNGYPYYYVLQAGDLHVEVVASPDNPDDVSFSFSATNLSLAYYDWSGTVDPTHTATVSSATADGVASQYGERAPTGDSNLASFTPDFEQLYRCNGCTSTGGDQLVIYASDSASNADLSLFVPLSALAMPGSSTLTGGYDPSAGCYGDVRVMGPPGTPTGPQPQYTYKLETATVMVSSSSLTVGQSFGITIQNASFVYVGNSGTTSDAHLTIGSADLTHVAADQGATPPPPNGP